MSADGKGRPTTRCKSRKNSLQSEPAIVVGSAPDAVQAGILHAPVRSWSRRGGGIGMRRDQHEAGIRHCATFGEHTERHGAQARTRGDLIEGPVALAAAKARGLV